MLSNEMMLSIRSIVERDSLVDRMRWVTEMLFLILGLSLGRLLDGFKDDSTSSSSSSPCALPFFLEDPLEGTAATFETRSRVVLRAVATNSQSPMANASDSSDVVGAMASNRATAFMNSFRSWGIVRKRPVGDVDVRSLQRSMRLFRARMMGGDPAASSSSSEGGGGGSSKVSTSDGTSVVEYSWDDDDDGDGWDRRRWLPFLFMFMCRLGAKADTPAPAAAAATAKTVAKLNFIFYYASYSRN